MTEKSVWNQQCHDTVKWPRVEKNTELIEWDSSDTGFDREESKNEQTTVIAGISSRGPTFEVRDPVGAISKGARAALERMQRSGDPSIEDLRELVSFFENAHCFVGYRERWDEDILSENDKNALTQMVDNLDEIVNGNASREYKYGRIVGEPVDFTKNLICYGGPVANWYTRNLLYGDEAELPYKFNLNPDSYPEDLSDKSPQELRKFGGSSARGANIEGPNWHLSDNERAEPAKIGPEETKPEPDESNDRWHRDYFMIVKSKNIHEDSEGLNDCLTLAGCHGYGTEAAAKVFEDRELVNRMASKAGKNDFQAIGRVERTDEEGDVGEVEILEIECL